MTATASDGANLRMEGVPTLARALTTPPPIPESGRARAAELMESGLIFRYGETGASELDAASLEQEFAASLDRRYCVATNSCGAAMAVALRSVGVASGDGVLMNAFTLAPVPGAVAHVGAHPVLVDIDADYRIDLASLERAVADSGARVLLLSYMRGHIPDMTQVMATCERLGITVVEDCAHTMGADWAGTPMGTFGTAACFSTQTYKHINSGEGGLIVTDDDDVAAHATLLSGSYMLYEQHGTRPPTDVMDRHRLGTPNWSMRMTALTAALIRSQLPLLGERRDQWRRSYDRIITGLADTTSLRLPARPEPEGFVPSSLQFSLQGFDTTMMESWLATCAAHGLHVKWFGRDDPQGFTSRFDHWSAAEPADAAQTSAILSGLCDIRLPLDLTDEDCDTIAAIVHAATLATIDPS